MGNRQVRNILTCSRSAEFTRGPDTEWAYELVDQFAHEEYNTHILDVLAEAKPGCSSDALVAMCDGMLNGPVGDDVRTCLAYLFFEHYVQPMQSLEEGSA